MSRKKKNRKNNKSPYSIDINDILLKDRQLFLFEAINDKISKDLIRELRALDKLKKAPILLNINAPGGNCGAGLAIIDTIKNMRSPVTTLITGEACSMASIISVVGKKRYITKNAYWMAHPMSTGSYDYLQYVKDRVKFSDELEKVLINIYKENTKLTKSDYDKMIKGELWLNSQECLKKGIVDKIL